MSSAGSEPPAELWLRQADATAAFAPSEGFCCTALRVRDDDGWRSVLSEPPSWDALRARPAFYGNPLLFPYPFGLRAGAFTLGGRRHVLRPGRAGRVAHGLVRDHLWALERTWEDAAGAHARATISNAGDPDRLAEFPFPFVLRVEQTLSGRTLRVDFEATNVGDDPMPAAFAIHPYFPRPAAGWLMRSNVTHRAHVAPDGRGVSFSPTDGIRPGDVAGSDGFPTYARLPSAVGGPAGEGAGLTWSLVDPAGSVAVSIESSPEFAVVLLFVPSTGEVVSPVVSTCLPLAFNLHELDRPSGTRIVAPGETWRGWTALRAP